MKKLLLPSELLGNVVDDDLLLLFVLNTLLLPVHLVMLRKVRNILWMNQILLAGVFAVILLKVMDLILVLIIAMVAWAKSKIWKVFAVRCQVQVCLL
jgi:hypothetical protein